MSNNTWLVVLVAGVIFCIIGFGFRDRNAGLALMGISLFGVLCVSIYKAYITFS